jgi:hypothetical protein
LVLYREDILQVAERDTTLTTESNGARVRAEASFRKEERAIAGRSATVLGNERVETLDSEGLKGHRVAIKYPSMQPV